MKSRPIPYKAMHDNQRAHNMSITRSQMTELGVVKLGFSKERTEVVKEIEVSTIKQFFLNSPQFKIYTPPKMTANA
jgi:hypothetical protein